MTLDEILRRLECGPLDLDLAQHAGAQLHTLITRAETAEKRLAEAVAAEREACVKIAYELLEAIPSPRSYEMAHYCMGIDAAAIAIRARGSAKAQKDDDGWLPIESAPQDGKEYLLAFEGQFKWVIWVGRLGPYGLIGGDHADPTHWRPLPPAPQADGEGV